MRSDERQHGASGSAREPKGQNGWCVMLGAGMYVWGESMHGVRLYATAARARARTLSRGAASICQQDHDHAGRESFGRERERQRGAGKGAAVSMLWGSTCTCTCAASLCARLAYTKEEPRARANEETQGDGRGGAFPKRGGSRGWTYKNVWAP